MFLSFIIPVYNAEAYLAHCLNSLLAQDLAAEDYEILCVNDGSTDRSPAILRQFEENHPNITVIHKENGGVTTARNAGLAAAKGDYIWFIDSDDLVKPNCLSRLKALTGPRCDRVVFGAYQFLDELTEEEWALSRQNQLPVNTSWYDAVVWRCILRTSFLRAHSLTFRYPELTHGEDGLFMYEVTRAEPMTLELDEVLYFYREHSGSAETSITPTNRMRKLRSYIRIVQILRDSYASGSTDAATANKLMSFLWFAMYELAHLPAEDARPILIQLKANHLYPFSRLPQCTLTTSYMADPSSAAGKVLDHLYSHLHTPWGYHTVRLLLHLKRS